MVGEGASRALCRDCGARASVTAALCPRCASPRLARHPELDALAVAHVDCDAFFAAIEKRDDPSLRDRPVIVGGGRRGVVSTACYLARITGVHSAMPMFKALERCPDAVVVRPRMERYGEAARAVRRLMEALTPLVQPVSIDEAFLDLSGTERLHGRSAAESLALFAREVEREVGISVSVGLSYNRFLAKIASDQDKPRGFFVIGRGEAQAFLAERPIAIFPGIGAKTAERLAAAGLRRVRDLAGIDPRDLMRVAGRDADRLLRLARGEDDRPVEPRGVAKSVSAETTFSADLAALADLEPILWRLCERVSLRLKRAGLSGRSVTLKLKDRHFRLTTRSRSGLPATQLAQRLYEPAHALLAPECDGRLFRLIGIGAGDLAGAEEADRPDLADPALQDLRRIDTALDRLRERFGPDAVRRGLLLRQR